MMRSLFLVLVFLALTANSFTSVKKASFVKAAVSKRVFLQMSNEPETPPKSTDKTFYDDEVRSCDKVCLPGLLCRALTNRNTPKFLG